jgi:hypothetical protein
MMYLGGKGLIVFLAHLLFRGRKPVDGSFDGLFMVAHHMPFSLGKKLQVVWSGDYLEQLDTRRVAALVLPSY